MFLSNFLLLAIYLQKISFIVFMHVHCTTVSRTFNMKECWILTNAFSELNERIGSSFLLFIWSISLTDFWMLNYYYISGMKSTWSRCMVFVMCSWFSFESVLLTIIVSIFIRKNGMKFIFLITSSLVSTSL